MPAPVQPAKQPENSPVVVPQGSKARKIGTTTPLTVDAAPETSAPASAATPPAPTENATPIAEAGAPEQITLPNGAILTPEQTAQLHEMAGGKPVELFRENPDGSITVTLDRAVDVSAFGIKKGGVDIVELTEITLQRCEWRHRKMASKGLGVNASIIEIDSALMAVLAGLPEPVLDRVDARDMGIVQVALGKLLYSPKIYAQG